MELFFAQISSSFASSECHTGAIGGGAGEPCGAGKPKKRLGIIKVNYKCKN